MSGRLVRAEWLKLRKRRPLFWWSLVLTVGVVTVVFTILEILHLANPAHHGPPGGLDGFSGGMMGLVAASSIAAILIGATAGTADVSTGVFRDLVATGRPRRELFLARVPGALLLLVPIVTLGFAVVLTGSLAFAGGLQTPTAWMIVRGYGWVVLFTSFDVVIALGFSSLIDSRATTIGVLIGWQYIASPLLEQVKLLGPVRQALFTGALDRLDPAPITGGGGPPIIVHSVLVATAVLLAWMALMLLAGGWRTATRDA
jgi:ABC-type transport system involved in multi-copper enzyme maturation permease subunit